MTAITRWPAHTCCVAFAHELRTPLAVAQGWAAMMLDGDTPADAMNDTVLRLYEAL